MLVEKALVLDPLGAVVGKRSVQRRRDPHGAVGVDGDVVRLGERSDEKGDLAAVVANEHPFHITHPAAVDDLAGFADHP